MDGTRGMRSRRVDMWPGRGVVREVGRDFSGDPPSFPGESTGGKLEVKQNPVALEDDICEAQFESLTLELVSASHEVGVGSVERLTKTSPL
jgi:hypothetical protein